MTVTPLIGYDLRHLYRCENARAVDNRSFQQGEGAFPRVDHEIAIAHDGGRPRDMKLLVEPLSVQKAA